MPIPLPYPIEPEGVPPDPGAPPAPTHTVQPYYIREPQPWAVDQEHLRHSQALYMVGEYAIFALMWHIQDFIDGLVERCNRCFEAYAKVSDAYGQPAQNRCPDCFGTSFEGGYRALVVRPAIFGDTDESEDFDRRGVIHSDDVDIESTPDFRVRTGDYAFRQDGTRWKLRVPQRITLRTGFAYPNQPAAAIGYNHSRAGMEDPSSVAYDIPPEPLVVRHILSRISRMPDDFTLFEDIRGPLIPNDLLVDTVPTRDTFPGRTTYPGDF